MLMLYVIMSIISQVPIDWEAEWPKQDGLVPPDVQPSEVNQGQRIYISSPSDHDVSIEGPHWEGLTISESGPPQNLVWEARSNVSLQASLGMFSV